MAVTERLVDFPSKPSPVAADIIYVGDSADDFNEVQSTVGEIFAGYSANLVSIGALSTVADRMMYSTGVNTWALAAITSFGRSLIDDANASAARTTLGLGTMATQAAADYLLLAGGTMVGALILSTSTPSTDLEAASKGYVDAQISAFATVFVARLASTGNFAYTYANGSSGVGATLTASAPGTVTMDGTSVALNDLVLFKDQSTTFQNGYYKCTNNGSITAAVFTRATNYDTAAEISAGDLFVITAGSTLLNTTWIQTATVTVMGSSPITFSQYSVALPITVSSGGTGLTSLTAYGLMVAGTTSTGNMQQVTIGAAGTILQSGGSSALPAFSTATYPSTASATGAVMVSNGTNFTTNVVPAAGAYLTANQSVSSGAATKITLDNEEFDTNSNYDPTTNYRFTPTVAGYYQINAALTSSSACTAAIIYVYKNGSEFKRGTRANQVAGTLGINISCIVSMNGSTDYIEIFGAVVDGITPLIAGGQNFTYFSASLIRGA